MSLVVDNNIGYFLTTTFNFTTTLAGEVKINYGDGVIENMVGSSSHIYSDYGIYNAHIIDCDGNVYGEQEIVVKPHTEDSITITSETTETQAGKLSEKFFVEVCSNCPPPLKIKLDVIGSKTPYPSVIPNDSYKDVTPKKYFISDHLNGDNEIVLEEDDLEKLSILDFYCVGESSEYCVQSELECEPVSYKGSFCFKYYDDAYGDHEICATLERSCNLCDEKLRYYDIFDKYCFGDYENCFKGYMNSN